MKGYIIKEHDFKQILKVTEKDKATLRDESKVKKSRPVKEKERKVRKLKRKREKNAGERKLGQRLEGDLYQNKELSELQSESQ